MKLEQTGVTVVIKGQFVIILMHHTTILCVGVNVKL